MSSTESEPGRRSLLAMLGGFGALTLVVVGVSLVADRWPTARPRTAEVSVAPSEAVVPPEVAAFLGPLAGGERFGTTRIARILPEAPGALALALVGAEGLEVVVDVRARSTRAPAGVAETNDLAIYLRSRRGEPTTRASMRAATDLASALRAREEGGHAPPRLESLEEGAR